MRYAKIERATRTSQIATAASAKSHVPIRTMHRARSERIHRSIHDLLGMRTSTASTNTLNGRSRSDMQASSRQRGHCRESTRDRQRRAQTPRTTSTARTTSTPTKQPMVPKAIPSPKREFGSARSHRLLNASFKQPARAIPRIIKLSSMMHLLSNTHLAYCDAVRGLETPQLPQAIFDLLPVLRGEQTAFAD